MIVAIDDNVMGPRDYRFTGEYVWDGVAGILRASQWMKVHRESSTTRLRGEPYEHYYGLFSRVLKESRRDTDLADSLLAVGGESARLISDAARASLPGLCVSKKWRGDAVFKKCETLVVEDHPRNAWTIPQRDLLKAGAICSYKLQFSDPFDAFDALVEGPSVRLEVNILSMWAKEVPDLADLGRAISRRIEDGLGQFCGAAREEESDRSIWMPLVLSIRTPIDMPNRDSIQEELYRQLIDREPQSDGFVPPLNDGDWATIAIHSQVLPPQELQEELRLVFYGRERKPRKVKTAGALNVLVTVDDPHHFAPPGRDTPLQYVKHGRALQGSGIHRRHWLLVVDPVTSAFIAILDAWRNEDESCAEIESAWNRPPEAQGFGRTPTAIEAGESLVFTFGRDAWADLLRRRGVKAGQSPRPTAVSRVARYWGDVMKYHFSQRHPADVARVDARDLQSWANEMTSRIWRGEVVCGPSSAPPLRVDLNALRSSSGQR